MRRLIASAGLRASRTASSKRSIVPSQAAVDLTHSRLSDEVRWSTIINKAAKAVVALRTSNVRTFDSSAAACTQATGFVVDKELGLVLTNRHVVLVGPVTAEAIFENHEGVVCKPIYRDPIHDFGFCKLAVLRAAHRLTCYTSEIRSEERPVYGGRGGSAVPSGGQGRDGDSDYWQRRW
jgi:S1-C subfamily serine protease